MKLIFSRKGFDSSAGGIPSPILPDGRMISLPIPANPYDKKTLHDVIWRKGPETHPFRSGA